MRNITISGVYSYGFVDFLDSDSANFALGDGSTVGNIFCCPRGMPFWRRVRAAWVLVFKAK